MPLVPSQFQHGNSIPSTIFSTVSVCRGGHPQFFPQSTSAGPLFRNSASASRWSATLKNLVVRQCLSAITLLLFFRSALPLVCNSAVPLLLFSLQSTVISKQYRYYAVAMLTVVHSMPQFVIPQFAILQIALPQFVILQFAFPQFAIPQFAIPHFAFILQYQYQYRYQPQLFDHFFSLKYF